MRALRVLAATFALCVAPGSATAGASVIAAGETTTCVATPSGGPAACWGANTEGSLGDGGVVSHDSFDPVQPIGLTAGVTAVALSVVAAGRATTPARSSRARRSAGARTATVSSAMGRPRSAAFRPRL
jgi:hypothetical protein